MYKEHRWERQKSIKSQVQLVLLFRLCQSPLIPRKRRYEGTPISTNFFKHVLPCTIIKMKLLICKKILATISLKTGSAISNANTLNISLIKALYFNLDTDWRAKTRRHLKPCVVLECVLVHYSEHYLLTLSTTKQVSWEIPKSLFWFCLQKQLCLVICLDAWIATHPKFGAYKKVSWQVYSSLLSWKDTKRTC